MKTRQRTSLWELKTSVLLAGLLALASCGPSEEVLEARRVARAIDLVRDAPNDPVSGRKALLEKRSIVPGNSDGSLLYRAAAMPAEPSKSNAGTTIGKPITSAAVITDMIAIETPNQSKLKPSCW